MRYNGEDVYREVILRFATNQVTGAIEDGEFMTWVEEVYFCEDAWDAVQQVYIRLAMDDDETPEFYEYEPFKSPGLNFWRVNVYAPR